MRKRILVMKRQNNRVAYSYEHGDKSLPHIKDLVSDVPDVEKKKIMEYLRTNCVMTCPGIVHDEINPEKVIGCGNTYYDGTYFWNDVFFNYVDRYNIPVPKDFREHILRNYSARKKRHMQLQIVNRIIIQNNPYLGYKFTCEIDKKGIVKYRNNMDCPDGIVTNILPEDAEYIINPIMTDLFCYDSDDHGAPIIDGHHWKITFYRYNKVMEEKEGWEGEDEWRYDKFKRVVEFIERYIPKSLGSEYMRIKGSADCAADFSSERTN